MDGWQLVISNKQNKTENRKQTKHGWAINQNAMWTTL